MPTESDPKDLLTTTVPSPPSQSDLEGQDETPAESDPAGSKEADAVAAGPEIEIPLPTEDPSETSESQDGGAKDQSGPEAASAEPGAEQSDGEVGRDDLGGTDSAPSDGDPEPSTIDAPADNTDGRSDSEPADRPAGLDPEATDPDGSAPPTEADGEPEALTPELETPDEDPKGPPSSDEVETIDAEFEPAEDEDEPEGVYSGLQPGKEHIHAGLTDDGLDALLAAGNESYRLIERLRPMASTGDGPAAQEAQFLLGIGALWLAQLERWLARR